MTRKAQAPAVSGGAGAGRVAKMRARCIRGKGRGRVAKCRAAGAPFPHNTHSKRGIFVIAHYLC